MKNKTGTREWSERSLNITAGCPHRCRYCYGRFDAVVRYKRMTQEQWDNPVTDQKKVDKDYRKHYDGVTMFPTVHEITSSNLSECMCVLRKQLDLGNKILIVSKPHWDCITVICEAFMEYQDLIEFRFTIGSTKDDVLKFWEPGAPGFEERLSCLQYAYQAGYKTSVSCEPYLDCHVNYTYIACEDYLTESFWIGKLRNFNSRVNLDNVTHGEMSRYVDTLKAALDDDVVKSVFAVLDGQPFIKWKDSIRDVMDKVRSKK